jgi:putative transposase
MARLPRLVVRGHLHHLIARGHNDQPIAIDDTDFQTFMSTLRESAQQAGVAIHAYVLLPNRLQLLVTPSETESLGKMMQAIGRHYVPYFNARHRRSGGLWEGRFRATVVESDAYFIPCAQLIEQQPLRERLVDDVSAYPWSSHAHHSGRRREAWITDHPAYWALGNTPFDREAAYQRLSDTPVSAALVAEIESATHKSWPLGSDTFLRSLGKLTPRRLEPAKRGRPRKHPSGATRAQGQSKADAPAVSEGSNPAVARRRSRPR